MNSLIWKSGAMLIGLDLKLAFAVAATTRKCGRGLLITGQLFTCLAGVS